MFTLIVSLFFIIPGHFVGKAAEKTISFSGLDALYIVLMSFGFFFLLRGVLIGISSVISRKMFCRRLKKMCKDKGYDYKEINSPIKAFFTVYGGEDIVISRRERVIRLKFFQGFVSKWFVHIENERVARIFKRLAFVGGNIKMSAYGGVNYSGSKGKVVSDTFLKFKKKIDLSFSKDNFENIVIISPKCYDMTVVEGNSKQTVGSGSCIFNSKIYYQMDFLSYFDRM